MCRVLKVVMHLVGAEHDIEEDVCRHPWMLILVRDDTILVSNRLGIRKMRYAFIVPLFYLTMIDETTTNINSYY